MKSSLAVIVPLYDQEMYIEECIKSICKQKIGNLSVIIVNDGSTDNSPEICERLAETDNRIRIISQDNRGLAEARLAGITGTDAKYITFVDADDFITENAYDDAIGYMEEDFDQIFFEISRYYNEGRTAREYHIIKEGVYDKDRIAEEIYPKLIWDFEKGTPGIECSQCVRIVKRELLLQAYKDLGNRRFYYGEDIAITYPMFLKINKLAVISKSFYMHRQRSADRCPEYIMSDGYFSEVYQLFDYVSKKMDECDDHDFTRQIEYRYILSVELKKCKYKDFRDRLDRLFPFDKVEPEKRIILYGAGHVGREYYRQLQRIGYCKTVLWVDRDAKAMGEEDVHDLSVLNTGEALSFDYVVIAIENPEVVHSVKDHLLSLGFPGEKMIV